MTEPRTAPSQLEQTLGRLVAAGVAQPAHLAALLGLESHHVGRPLRALTRAGVLDSDQSGALRLTAPGRGWLGVERSPTVTEPTVHRSADPQLLSPLLEVEEERGSDGGLEADLAAEGQPDRSAPFPGPARVRGAWSARRSAFLGAALAAGAGVVVLGMRVGVPATDRAHDDPPMLTATPAPVSVATPFVVAPTAPPERWVVVQHTNGLGLVLRPSPASTSRVLTLQEGARVRVTGDPIQQAGHAWIPVASLTGKTGWVAGDFVSPVP